MSQRVVFVDTWGWIGWTVRTDKAHRRAADLSQEIREGGGQLVSSNFVLAEAMTRVRWDVSHPAALRLLDEVAEIFEGAFLEIVVVDTAIWQEAVAWFRRFDDQKFSFVDCTSFAIMADRGLHEALTADRHFATAGFVPLGA